MIANRDIENHQLKMMQNSGNLNDLEKNLKDLEQNFKDTKDLVYSDDVKNQVKDDIERPIGEPEDTTKILITELISQEDDNLTEITEIVESKAPPFKYAETKLRPDAPPFTPECIEPISDVLYVDPETTNGSFVNVDLSSFDDQVIPLSELPASSRTLKDLRDSKEQRLKPFSLTSSSNSKKVCANTEIPTTQNAQAVVSVTTQKVTGEEEVTSPPQRIINRRPAIFSANFLFGNKTQIAVLLSSI
ncbi:uncharacterized protein LOC112494862 isoform X2 [Cephus cinctus]|uniref:Uncharacterized protein LOC112494862 isoform X2 n=1 Tax=Cephus cinctus TaxID=211228 RepID=A0AAJ7RNC5_CEPCN|nr:uncharacterized protein LOC112494862 isoform X2 [Cephus cinctus]